MPAFDEEVLAATAEVDALFGETFVLRPYMQGANKGAPLSPDPARPTVSIVGIWFAKPADAREPHAYDQRQYRRPGVTADAPHVEFSASALTDALTAYPGFALRAGDQIERTGTGMAYEALPHNVSPNGTVKVPVNKLGSA